MPSELEALVGHLFIVGGHSINAASPGSIAKAPPRKAARGREADTLFGLITLSEEQHQPAAFYEGLSSELCAKYFSTAGSLTSALREAIGAIHSTLRQGISNLADPVRVGLACAILHEQELTIAMVGPVKSFFIHQGLIERLAGDNEWAEDMAALGAETEPDIKMYRREAAAADFLILSDLALGRLKDATFLEAVQKGEVDGVLNSLRAAAGASSSAEIIKFVTPLVEPQAAPRPKAAPVATEEPVELSSLPPARRLARGAALGLARVVNGAQTLVNRILPDGKSENAPEQRLQLSTTMQIGIAISVTVVAAILTTAVYRWRGQSSQYAQLTRAAQNEVELATQGGADQAAARPHWETALFLLEQASQIRPGGSEIAEMRSKAQAALDSYDHITRVTPVMLREYPPGAYMKGPIIQGLDLYVLDTTQDILYREGLDQSGTGLVTSEPEIITRQGEQVTGQVIGGLIDLTWMEDGGVPQRNVLAVLDRGGLLITYSPSWSVTATPLPGFEAWIDPRAVAVFNRDLYILDAGANEVWVYRVTDNSYSSTPQRYFTSVAPALADAVDMEVDTNGVVYILHSSGNVSKYFFGQQQDFIFEGLPQPLARPTSLNLSLNLIDRSFLISDPGGSRLYTVTPSGTFLMNYKDADGTIFNALSGAYSLDRPPVIYLTAGNRLYYFLRPG